MKGKFLFGVLLLVIGIGIILENLGIWYFSDFAKIWWPLIFILIGFANILEKKNNRGMDFILILIGIFILLFNFKIIGFNFLQFFWPVLFIVAGLWILFGRNKFPKNIDVSEDIVDYFIIFSGLNNINYSKDFKGGRIFTAFGGVDLDLRNASIQSQEAELNIFTAFGGVEIRVPEDWKVIMGGVPILGGWDNKTRIVQYGESRVLKVKCTVAFGGVEIRN